MNAIETVKEILSEKVDVSKLKEEDPLTSLGLDSLDLVEVSPAAEPPVCKLMDYGKFRYEQAKKEKDSKFKRRTLDVKEVKLRPKIDDNDFNVKKNTAERILKTGNKVKITLMFRGREVVYTELGKQLMMKLSEELEPICTVERAPKLEGRNMIMILAPKSA